MIPSVLVATLIVLIIRLVTSTANDATTNGNTHKSTSGATTTRAGGNTYSPHNFAYSSTDKATNHSGTNQSYLPYLY